MKLTMFAKFFVIVFCCWMAASPAFALETNPLTNPMYRFYARNSISAQVNGRGETGVAQTGGLDVALLNPAAFSPNGKLSIVMDYGYKNDIAFNWATIEETRLCSIKPLFRLGISIPLNNRLAIGFIYHQKESMLLDYGTVPVTRIENSLFVDSGTLCLKENYSVKTLTIPVSYQVTPWLKAGINLHNNYYQSSFFSEGAYQYVGREMDESHWNFQGGLLMDLSDHCSVGLSYTPEYSVKSAVIPKEAGVGITYKFDKGAVFLDGHYVNSGITQKWTSYYSGGPQEIESHDLIDQYRVHVGMEYFVLESLCLRAGIYTQNDCRTESIKKQIGAWNEKALSDDSQVFFTSGFSFYAEGFEVCMSYARGMPKGRIQQDYLGISICSKI